MSRMNKRRGADRRDAEEGKMDRRRSKDAAEGRRDKSTIGESITKRNGCDLALDRPAIGNGALADGAQCGTENSKERKMTQWMIILL